MENVFQIASRPVLRAYFDRSELYKPYGIVAVAGFLSTANLWERFEKNWREVLSENGVSSFRMAEFENRQGKFKNWSNPQRKVFIRRLIGVINRNALLGAGAAVVTADYFSLSEAKRLKLGPTPYSWCALDSVILMMKWMRKRGESAPIACVFELGDEGAWVIGPVLEGMRLKNDDFDKRFHSVHFESKSDALPLQAADLFAYETAKQVLRTVGLDAREIRRSLHRILKRTEVVGEYFNAEGFRRLLGDDGESPVAAGE